VETERSDLPADDAPPRPDLSWRLLPAFAVCASAFLLFALQWRLPGYGLLLAGLLLAFALDRPLARHLLLIGLGLGIISTMSLQADLSDTGMLRFSLTLGAAVAVPSLVSRFVHRENVIRFPVRTGKRWSRLEWSYLGVVVLFGYLVLPAYFIGSGVYRNWPEVTTPELIGRLFVGVNGVGLWDELFFICTVFALLRHHFSFWTANLLQAVVFVSFLWELGYRSWGPLLTIPFALVQGYTFARTRSLTYVVCVHLLFDLVVFGVLVAAHNPGLPRFFVTAP
jgi:hypothetical protein